MCWEQTGLTFGHTMSVTLRLWCTFRVTHAPSPAPSSLRSKRSRTSRMKSDRAKELFRIRAARKVGLVQFGRARSEARAKMWKKRAANSTFLLSPHFPRGSNAKLFRAVRFHSARTGTLATQATPHPVAFAGICACLEHSWKEEPRLTVTSLLRPSLLRRALRRGSNVRVSTWCIPYHSVFRT